MTEERKNAIVLFRRQGENIERYNQVKHVWRRCLTIDPRKKDSAQYRGVYGDYVFYTIPVRQTLSMAARVPMA
jgi:hypothetical protein